MGCWRIWLRNDLASFVQLFSFIKRINFCVCRFSCSDPVVFHID